jgi:hypothetical protein
MQSLNIQFITKRYLRLQGCQGQAVGVIATHYGASHHSLHFAAKGVGKIAGKFLVRHI